MHVPAELVEIGSIDDGFSAEFHWRIAIERRMHAKMVVIISEVLSSYFTAALITAR